MYGGYIMVRERDITHGGIYKHPFVQGDGRVFLRQPLEYGQINGEADLGEQAEKVSDEAAIAGTGGLAAHDEYECAHSPYKDAQHFLVGDRLFQIDCSIDFTPRTTKVVWLRRFLLQKVLKMVRFKMGGDPA